MTLSVSPWEAMRSFRRLTGGSGCGASRGSLWGCAPVGSRVPRHGQLGAKFCSSSSSKDDGSVVKERLMLQLLPSQTAKGRARSASEASLLRRKGRLKEQDDLISFIIHMHQTANDSFEVMQKMEKWVQEHRTDPHRSRIKQLIPSIGQFFQPLPLVRALMEYDEFFALTRRQFVPPNFAEIRHVLNIAQIHASAESLRLITFDADGTLYADGEHIEHDSQMISLLIALLRSDVHVAIVTAAGYPGEPEKFELRMRGLLDAFRDAGLPPAVTDRFHMMGGECNYLLNYNHGTQRLEFVDDSEWKSPFMMSWSAANIELVLDEAQVCLLQTAERLQVPVKVIRKERSVGVVPQQPCVYEILEEMTLTLKAHLVGMPLPFCAFNGGNDVFVDIGNKSLGLEALMSWLDFKPHEVLHVGDRFTSSGNDSAVRDCCSILWVAYPGETFFFVQQLIGDIRSHRAVPYLE